jgi:hypothetical protein
MVRLVTAFWSLAMPPEVGMQTRFTSPLGGRVRAGGACERRGVFPQTHLTDHASFQSKAPVPISDQGRAGAVEEPCSSREHPDGTGR